ncbi:hypothetical protein Ancab_025135 [Ancistrocladus abbreviatus]
MGPIAPAPTARIPPDPRGQGCLVESGTGVGDPEGSALVGPLMIIPRPPASGFSLELPDGERRVKNDVKGRRSGYLRGGKCALTSQRGRRVVNEARRRGNGPDRTGTNDPDPTRPTAAKGDWSRAAPGVGDPKGSALVGPLMIIPRPSQRLFRSSCRGGDEG